MECSEDSNWGQWGSRYTIHASRQSNDKVLRSLLLLPIEVLTIMDGEQSFLIASLYRYKGRTISSHLRVGHIVSEDTSQREVFPADLLQL